jgi:hypothetical protein
MFASVLGVEAFPLTLALSPRRGDWRFFSKFIYKLFSSIICKVILPDACICVESKARVSKKLGAY